MDEPITDDELTRRLPALLAAVSRIEKPDDQALREAVIASGLPYDDDPDVVMLVRSWVPIYAFPCALVSEKAAFERKLRSAVSRAVGRTSGGDKHWDVGSYAVTLKIRGDVVALAFDPQLSIARLASAAADWLDGVDAGEWLVAYDIRDEDDRAPSPLHLPRPAADYLGATLGSRADQPLGISLFMEPGVRTSGSRATSDDARFDEILALLTERLGAPMKPGWWTSHSRSFAIRRMRSGTRSISFTEAASGKITTAVGHVVDAPTTPDPIPAEGIAFAARLAAFRAQPVDDVITALRAEGALDDQEPQRFHGLVRVFDPHGRPIQIFTIDGRFARASVQLAPAPTSYAEPDANAKVIAETLDETFGPQLGEAATRRWRHGPISVQFGGRSSDPDFPRTQLVIGEDLLGHHEAGRWLTESEPAPDIRLHDAWHGRCFGAAISADAVPAVNPGMPVWRVDERLLWLENDRLMSAGAGQWPAWAPALAGGGTMEPPTIESLSRFVEIVAGWRWPSVEDVWSALVDLGWATPDPDTLVQESEFHATLRLRRPAGRYLAMQLHDGRVETWMVEVAIDDDRAALTPVLESLREILAPYSDPGAPGRAQYTVGRTAIQLDEVGWARGGGTVILHADRHLPARH